MRGGITAIIFRNFVLCGAATISLCGCQTMQGGPNRLFSINEEVDKARSIVDKLQAQYYTVDSSNDALRKVIRNEYIARRMYIIDVEYSDYEAALTRERQQVGFAADSASFGLTAASTLVNPGTAARVLSGAAGAVLAEKGFYDQDVIIAKTIQIAQGQMRTLRDEKAAWVLTRMALPAATYPLSQALHDLEDYYRAGTLTAGLIKAAGDSGSSAQKAAEEKEQAVTVNFVPVNDLGTRILTFWRASAKNKTKVRQWLDDKGGSQPLPFFLRSGKTDLFRKMIQDLSVP